MKKNDFEDFKLRLELSLEMDYQIKKLAQFVTLLTKLNQTDRLRSLVRDLTDVVYNHMGDFKSDLPEEDE